MRICTTRVIIFETLDASCALCETNCHMHPHQPVDAEDMKAFDTLPDEAQLDVRKEARYLAYVCFVANCLFHTNVAQGGHQLGCGDARRPLVCLSLLAIQLLHPRCVVLSTYLVAHLMLNVLSTGLGLFTEVCLICVVYFCHTPHCRQTSQGYVLFSNGNLKTLYQKVPSCQLHWRNLC